MRDYIEIGPTPAGESCEQLGPHYDPARARHECQQFIYQLRREFGPEPDGARLKIRSNPHDFGTYYEVACYYDTEIEATVEYAFMLEAQTPEWWDDLARANMASYDSPVHFGIR